MSTTMEKLEMSPGLGLKDTVEEYLMSVAKEESSGEEEDDDQDCELDLTGIDDDEISSYIMTDAEIKNKTKLWMTVNKEYLEEQAEKEEKEKKEIAEMIAKGIDPAKKRKNYKKKSKSVQPNGTAIEAIEKIVMEKKISTKINYDVLKSLNFGIKSPSSGGGTDSESVFGESGLKTPTGISDIQRGCDVKSGLKRPLNRDDELKKEKLMKIEKVEPPVLDVRSRLTASRTKVQPNLSQRSKMKTAPAEPVIESGPVINSDPIVESGPVVETGSGNVSEAETDEDDDDEMSAAQLLSKHMGGDGGGYEEEEDYY